MLSRIILAGRLVCFRWFARVRAKWDQELKTFHFLIRSQRAVTPVSLARRDLTSCELTLHTVNVTKSLRLVTLRIYLSTMILEDFANVAFSLHLVK